MEEAAATTVPAMEVAAAGAREIASMLRQSRKKASSNPADRAALRTRIQAALGLAIADSPSKAFNTLAEVRSSATSDDNGLRALYFQAFAVANIKARNLDEGFKAFEVALDAARTQCDPGVLVRVLNNYRTAATHTGRIDVAVARLEEALKEGRRVGYSVSILLVSLGEALFAAGHIQRAAALLHEFYALDRLKDKTLQVDTGNLVLAAAAVAIRVGIALSDFALLALSCDVSLLELGFARRDQWLLGPIVEAFCALYEHKGRREEHDSLLNEALSSLSSLDNSLDLGVRAARLASAHHLPRIRMLMSSQCSGNTNLLRAYSKLFDSFIWSRRQVVDRAKVLASQAAVEFAWAGRPLTHAFALEAGGLPDAARTVRRRCGASLGTVRTKWTGTAIPRRLASALTPRESEIAKHVAEGLSNRAIAHVLGLSERTVHHHCEAILGKLGIRSRWQVSSAIPWALK